MMSTSLALEYADVAKREEIIELSGLSRERLETLLDALFHVCHWHRIYYTWRPNLPDDTCKRLRQLARQRHMSLNKLMEELASAALSQHNLEAHFAARAARGSVEAGLQVLAELDARDTGRASQ